MKKAKITNKEGLHARPATLFCKEAKKYESDVKVTKNGETINGKSIIHVMGAEIEFGDEIVIEAVGTDAVEAEIGLVKLLESL